MKTFFSSGRWRRIARAASPYVLLLPLAVPWSPGLIFVAFFTLIVWFPASIIAICSVAWSMTWLSRRLWSNDADSSSVSSGLPRRSPSRLIIFILTVSAICFGLYWRVTPHPPNDAALERRFKRKRRDFERLVAIRDEGRGGQHGDEYEALSKKLGVALTLDEGNAGDVVLFTWSWDVGFAGGGIWGVGYLHCSHPHSDSESHPACSRERESGKIETDREMYRFKRIALDWYIIEEQL